MTAPDGGPDRRRPRDGELELAEQLAELSDKHSQLATDVSQLGAHLQGEQQQLRTQVAALAGSVTGLTKKIDDAFGEDAADPTNIDWYTLDRTEAEEAWAGLWRWLVEFYLPRYAPTREELPDCWPRHPGMRDELSWLWCAQRAAYAPGAAVGTAAQWHTLWRAGAFAQIQELARRLNCGPAKCQGHRLGDLPGDNEPTREEVWRSEWIQTDLEARPLPATEQQAG
ncbi:hypothetical protein ABT324_30810 [Saccharopolyspora sp. NPDC000359]|uniref:hypothetical protein n=1 Tax=Saccharopolyspora sp. NPDC000359 TaxID=3154251 RepID=UPI00332A203C